MNPNIMQIIAKCYMYFTDLASGNALQLFTSATLTFFVFFFLFF